MTSMLDAISAAIAECRNITTPQIVTDYVVIASFMDEDGLRGIWEDTAEGQRCHQTLGLLAYGQAIESAHAVDEWEDDE